MPQRPHLTATPATDRPTKRPTQPVSQPADQPERPNQTTYPPIDLACPLESHTQITQTCTSLCNALINFVCTNIVPPPHLAPPISVSHTLPLRWWLHLLFVCCVKVIDYLLWSSPARRIESSATNVKFAGKMFSTFHFVFRPANATCHVPLVVAKQPDSPLFPLCTQCLSIS